MSAKPSAKPSEKSSAKAHATAADTTRAVDAFMATLTHPCKVEIEALRHLILAADPSIAEGVKWNAPSFRTGDYFATTHLRAKSGIALILHLGARARALPEGGVAIDDPAKLLTWLAKDRALIAVANAGDLADKAPALTAILRQWIVFV